MCDEKCKQIKIETLKYFERIFIDCGDAKTIHERANILMAVSGAIRLAERGGNDEIVLIMLDQAIAKSARFFEKKGEAA